MPGELPIALKWGGAALAAVVPVAGLYFGAVRHFRERLKVNDGYRKARAEDLRQPRIARLYEDWLDGALEFLRTLMGAPWSPRAFGVCLTLGLLYSFLFLVISWGFLGTPGRVGQFPLLPDWPPAWRRSVGAAALLYFVVMYYISWRLDRWAVRRGTFIAGALAGALAVAGAVAGPLAGALGVAVAGALAVAIAGTLAVDLAGAGAVVVALTLGVAVLGSFRPFDVKPGPTVQALMLFLVILPAANALWDWVSWWISRWLGHHLLKVIQRPDLGFWRRGWATAWHMVADFTLALAFLLLLARTLPWGIGRFNAWIVGLGGAAPFELADYLCASAKAPWSTGLWATLMLLSTLVPTALHATAALASPLAAVALWLQRHEALATRLESPETGPALDAAVDDAAAYLAWTWIIVWIFAGAFVTVAFVGLLWLGNLVTGDLPAPLPGSLREFILGVALWDFEAAKACLAAPAAGA